MALNPNASIPAMLLARAAAQGNAVVLRKKDRGIWQAMTWSELTARVRQIGIALQSVGFRSGDAACVLAETRPEWAEIDLGVLSVGGVSVGVHPAENATQLGHILREANASVLFVENEEQLDKALVARDVCPALRRIVILDIKGLRDFDDPACEDWHRFLAHGATADDATWRAGIATIAAEQPALLLLPQDSAGKGHRLTHGDVLRLVTDAAAALKPRPGDERLAVLPMSHVMERVLGLYLALHCGVVSNYLESPATIVENLQELQPTMLGADPQIWQRLHARTTQAVAGATSLQKMLYRWAIGSGGMLARLLVLRAVRRELGFARLRLAYVGAAPVAPEVKRWAAALGITIQQMGGNTAPREASDASYRALMEQAYST